MVAEISVKSDSCNGFLPDGTKPLIEPLLGSPSLGSVVFTWEQFSMSGQATILYQKK